MNLKRFTARTSREALALVRQTFGEDAVVMSTRPCPEGVEVLAMAPESVQQLERVGAHAAPAAAPAAPAAPKRAAPVMPTPPEKNVLIPASVRAGARHQRIEPQFGMQTMAPVQGNEVEQDVAQMAMSTLSFQDYVRERMLKRRQAEINPPPQPEPPLSNVAPMRARRAAVAAAEAAPEAPAQRVRAVPVLREEIAVPRPSAAIAAQVAAPMAAPTLSDLAPKREPDEMMTELRRMRGLIEQRFGALAFMEKLQREPRHATLTTRLLEAGFSPQLIRRLADSLPADGDAMAWAGTVLERNLAAGDSGAALEDQSGVFALIGTTGVGKTTSTAKLAAAFAAKHGAANLGLITLDAYRIGAHEQLRQYGRILGVPVHVAHDRASLEDLLELLSAKKMVLIDTAGTAQRDTRTRELLDMLAAPHIKRLLVMNAAAQGETFEDVVSGFDAAQCAGVILSKIDEAVKLGPAVDVLIRHKLKVLAVANGQRVPEDWHRLSASALVQRALRSQAAPAWRFEAADVNLVFAGVPHPPLRTGAAAGAMTL